MYAMIFRILITATCLCLLCSSIGAQVITKPDSTLIFPGEQHQLSVLSNDSLLSAGNLEVLNAYSLHPAIYSGVSWNASSVKINRADNLSFSGYLGLASHVDTVVYIARQISTTNVDTGFIYVKFENNSFANLNANKLDARFSATGNHFWDFTGSSHFFAPTGSTKSPFFCNALWMAGKQTGGTLHLAAERYRQSGKDYWAGPVSNSYDSLFDRKWNRVWKVEYWQIVYHQANISNPNYTVFRDIAEWPAHGDTLNGQPWHIAPFIDLNANGLYEPTLGDYPEIKGDMALFFVFNDSRHPHTESGGIPFKLQVNAMAYAYNCPNSNMKSNTIFLHYDLINRSTFQYEDVYAGIFSDIDLGYADDDYVECDVKNGAFFGFNGDSVDGTGQWWAYGANPPYMGVQFLAGPYLDPDGLDNPRLDGFGNPLCDLSLNGAFFGNGIPDDERIGMTNFIYFNNSNSGIPSYMTDPQSESQHYNILQGIWKDSTQMLYGGNGHISTGAYGPACKFMFPGTSDPCNLGTGGIPPNGPLNWTEVTANNQPNDRRCLGASGPFSFAPGQVQAIDLAFVFVHDTINHAEKDTMRAWFTELKHLFINDSLYCGPSTAVGINTHDGDKQPHIFPNPSQNQVWVNSVNPDLKYEYQVISITGQIMSGGDYSHNDGIMIGDLAPGIYVIRMKSATSTYSGKFIKN
jgi:hypothetical protein